MELRTKLEIVEKHNRECLSLAERISKKSVDLEEESSRVAPQIKLQREIYSVVCTPKEPGADLEKMKTSIREVSRKSEGIPRPGDVMLTKAGQVILRVKKKADAEKIQEVLKAEELLKENVKINVPLRKRERILLLSVSPEVDETMVLESLEQALEEMSPEIDFGLGLLNRLADPALAGSAVKILEGLCSKGKSEIKIVKRIETRLGKVNWLIDTDEMTRDRLLAKKKNLY